MATFGFGRESGRGGEGRGSGREGPGWRVASSRRVGEASREEEVEAGRGAQLRARQHGVVLLAEARRRLAGVGGLGQLGQLQVSGWPSLSLSFLILFCFSVFLLYVCK